MPSNVFSGARADFTIDVPGQGPEKMAYAGGVSGEEAIDYEPIDVLDVLAVKEHVPVAYRCALNAQMFRRVGQSLKNLGIMPIEDNILSSGDMVATIKDSVSERTIAHVSGVRVASKSFDTTARSAVTENVAFVCIRIKDEAEL